MRTGSGWRPMPTKRPVRCWKPGMLVRMRKAQGWFHGALVVECLVDDAVGEGLDALGAADGLDAVLLDPLEVVVGEGVGAERVGEDVGGGDGVLQGDVDADAADGRHGVGGVADAEQAGEPPALEVIDLDGEELDFVPGVELGGAAGEEGRELFEAGAEVFEAVLLDVGVSGLCE